jgi:hypothetical protein
VQFYTFDKLRQQISNNGDISFYEDTGTTPKFFWDASAERLGIGTTSPSRTLDIESLVPAVRFTDASVSGLYHEIVSGDSNNLQIKADGGAVGPSSAISFDVDGSEKMCIKHTGNVGIGTTSPANTLTVGSTENSASDQDATVGIKCNANHKGIMLQENSGAEQWSIGVGEGGSLKFYDSAIATPAVTFEDVTGRVGIGTDSPAQALDVVGNITLDDNGKLLLGASDDLQLYHDGSNSYVKDSGTGSLVLQGASFVLMQSNEGENMVRGQKNAQVDLYHDNDIKLSTTSTGIDVDGNIAVSGTVDGVDIATLGANAITAHQDISGKANLSGASFTGNVNIGTPPSGTQSLTVAGATSLYGGASVTGDIAVTGTVDGRDVAADGTKLDLIDPSTYLTSFDITTQTDPKYLRSDAADTATGFINFTGGAGVTGDMGVSGGLSATNLDITKTGSVTTNISTGGYATSSDVKTINIGTGFNNGGFTTINIAPFSATTTKTINLNGNVNVSTNSTLDVTNIDATNIDANTIDLSGQLDAVVTSPAQNTPILELQKYSATSSGTGRFITLKARSTQTGATLTQGIIGLSNTTQPLYGHPYISSTYGSNGIKCSYSNNSSYNAILPCASTGVNSNGTLNFGHAYSKWNTVYASTGSISTSDITKKQDIEELSEAENRVAIAAKGLLRKYRWKEAVAEKGDNARIHFGIMAQDLKAAFESEGLDANKYGMFCADTRWTTDGTDTYTTEEEALEAVAEEEVPKAVTEETVYGVRYEELLTFIIAAL